MRCINLIVSLSIPLALTSAGKAFDIEQVSSFDELVSTVSLLPEESFAFEESSRLRYSVSMDAVQSRKEAILDKARVIDPGMKSNGKQSSRVSTARLVQDIHDQKSLDNIVLVAPFNGGDAHFTKIGLSYLYGRFYDQFPAKVQNSLLEQASEYTKYLEIGTENHTSMRRMAATIFGAACPDMQTSYEITGKELESISTQWIQDYGKVVFRSGLKEYLSPIYLGVHNEIWLTGAECGPNSAVRSMSQAVLDWIWADLAINSHFGQVIPPVTRAKMMLDRGAQASFPTTHAQYLSWIYWGNLHSTQIEDRLPDSVQSFHPGMTSSDMVKISEGFQTALLPAASNLVPEEIIRNIGAKNIELPYMLLQSRPHGHVLNKVALNPYTRHRNYESKEVIRNHLRSAYVARNYSLSGGYFRPDPEADNKQYQHVLSSALLYRSKDEFNSIIVSHPYWYAGTPHGNAEEATEVFGIDCWLGKSPYEQIVHWENTIIYMYDIPDVDETAKAHKDIEADKWVATRREDPLKKVCVYVPESIDEIRKTDWGWFLREGNIYIALRPIGTVREVWETCSNPVQAGYKRLVTDGSLQALIVEMGDAHEYGDAETFISKIGKTRLDLADFQSLKQIRYVSTRGIPFELKFNPDHWFPFAKVKNVALEFENWPICESPYVSSRDGILRINDGSNGLSIDWSKDMPEYSFFDPN